MMVYNIYQSIIGSLQWAFPIVRIDISTAVMSLSDYRYVPRIRNLEHTKKVVGCLSKMKEENYDSVYLYLIIQIYRINNMTGEN